MNSKLTGRRFVALGTVLGGATLVLLAAVAIAQSKDERDSAKTKYRGLLGPDSKKVKKVGDKVLLWAGGQPGGPEAQWYDFTGAPIPATKLQFGIGKDRIPAIDDPLFVAPDDPRLLKLPVSPYRPEERPESLEDLRVIGYAAGDQARAYPVGLLDHHELVNDRVGGKPVTVGW